MKLNALPCRQAEVLTNRFLDRDMTDKDRIALESHLDACPSCLRTFRMAIEIEGVLDTSLSAGIASPFVKESVASRKAPRRTAGFAAQKGAAVDWRRAVGSLTFVASAILIGLWVNGFFLPGEASSSGRHEYVAGGAVGNLTSPEGLRVPYEVNGGKKDWIAEEDFKPVDSRVSVAVSEPFLRANKFESERLVGSFQSALGELESYRAFKQVNEKAGVALSINHQVVPFMARGAMEGEARFHAPDIDGVETPDRPMRLAGDEIVEVTDHRVLSRFPDALEVPDRPDLPDRPERLALDVKKEAPEFAVVIRSVSRAERPEKPQRFKRHRPDRPDRPDRKERPSRPDRPDRPERPDRIAKPERPERPEKMELPETPEVERPEKPEVEDMPDLPDLPDKPDKPEMEDRPEKPDELGTPDVERPESPELLDRPEVPEAQEEPELPSRPGKAGRPHRVHRR